MRAAQNLRVQPHYWKCGMSRLNCEIYRTRGKQSVDMFCPTMVLHDPSAVPFPSNSHSLIMYQDARQQAESSFVGRHVTRLTT